MAFWVVGFCILRLVVCAGMQVVIVNQPHDDLLYVERAFRLLSGEWLGAYGEITLLKLPGFSLFLAAVRAVGVPYLLGMQLLYIGACLTLLAGLRRCEVSKVASLACFALALFHPLTLSHEWQFVMREPLSSTLLVALFGVCLQIAGRPESIFPWLGYGLILGFSLTHREEDQILWLFHALWIFLLIGITDDRRALYVRAATASLILFVIPASIRLVNHRQYGNALLHDIGEGEYPKLIETLRRVEPTTTDLHQVLTPQAVTRIESAVPEIAPLLSLALKERRPNDEGTLLFNIRGQAFRTGRVRSLPDSQQFYRRIRLAVSQACEAKKLPCQSARPLFLSPIKADSLATLVSKSIELARVILNPPMTPLEQEAFYGLPADSDRMRYLRVTMTPLLAERQLSGRWKQHGGELKWDAGELPRGFFFEWRSRLFAWGTWLFSLLAPLGGLILLLRCFLSGRPATPLGAVMFASLGLVTLKWMAFSYLSLSVICAVRLFYPLHLIVGIFGAISIADTVQRLVKTKFSTEQVTA